MINHKHIVYGKKQKANGSKASYHLKILAKGANFVKLDARGRPKAAEPTAHEARKYKDFMIRDVPVLRLGGVYRAAESIQ